jgi:pyruvate dehydrogenase E2 component (dihydrolipoamide acetyltransferase)
LARVFVDRENVNDEFVVINKIHKQDGASVNAGEPVLDYETSKTAAEIRAPLAGVLRIALAEGDEVAVGNLLFEVHEPSTTQSMLPSASVDVATADGPPPADKDSQRELSLAASGLSQRLGVNLHTLPAGWITASDIVARTSTGKSNQGIQAPDAASHRTTNQRRATPVPRAPFRAERISVRKRTEALVLFRSNTNGSNSTIGIEITIRAPRLVTPPFLFQDGIADVLVFEASRLLRRYAELNAFHIDDRTTGYYEQVNFGISFDAGRDLKVLTLQNADTLALAQVQAGIDGLLHLYESETPIDESLLTGSTITLSDLSRTSIEFMLPLLNADQSLIIGITRNGMAGFRLYATFDHRVSEGLQVAGFLGELRNRIESHYADKQLANLRCSSCDQTIQREVELGRRGLVRIVLPDATEGYLCHNCFQGW